MKNLTMRIAVIFMSATMFAVCAFAGILQPARTSEVIITEPSLEDQEQENNANNEQDTSDGNEGDPPKDDVPSSPQRPEPAPAPEETPPTASDYVRSKVNGLQIRSGPGSTYSSLGYIDKNDMVTLLGKEGNWYRTLYKNKTAYLSASESHTEVFSISFEDKNETVEKIIDIGLSLLGFPYVYGATRLHDGSGNLIKSFDKTKYDCSSLMQYIYYHGASINLNMTTRTQIRQGTYVAKSNLKRGDLMFFTNAQRYNKTGVERVGHVALYLGDNYILHTASDYAVIEQISSTRWGYYLESRTFFAT